MKVHSITIIPGEHYPETAIIDVMLQPDENTQSFRHVRASYPEFVVHTHGDQAAREWCDAMFNDLVAWAEGLKSRVSDAA